MPCCAVEGCAELFDRRRAAADAARYRRRGLDRWGRRLVAAARDRGLDGRTLLEIGGGVGAMQIELIRAGAARATSIELSPGYEDAAAGLLAEADLTGRVTRRVGELTSDVPDSERADIVVMHRVICCYLDVDGLVRAAARRAGSSLVLTMPRAGWWVRAAIALENLWHRLLGRSFRAYAHDPAVVRRIACEEGLTLARDERGAIWELLLFVRALTA